MVQKSHAQLRDSPGARLRSTASIAGRISSVGSGNSGSISSSTADRGSESSPDCELDENSEKIEGIRCRTGDHGGDELVGESKAENSDDDRVCVDLRAPSNCGGCTSVGCKDGVISILPPPTTCLFSNLDRRLFRVSSCSCVVAASCRGVIDNVPRSWA